MINHDRQDCVGQIEFTGEHSFWHAGHADQVAAVALEPPDLGCRLKARALHAPVGAAPGDGFGTPGGGIGQALSDGQIEGPGEIDMGDRLVRAFEEGVLTPRGVIDELIGNDQGSRPEIVPDAADGRDGNHRLGADFLERPEIGSVVDLVRRKRVAVAVAREEHHIDPVECSE